MIKILVELFKVSWWHQGYGNHDLKIHNLENEFKVFEGWTEDYLTEIMWEMMRSGMEESRSAMEAGADHLWPCELW